MERLGRVTKYTDVANWIGSDGSARRVNKRGTDVGVTVRLI